jgi:hypothetical protein
VKAPVYSLSKRRLRHAEALLSTLVVTCVLAQSPVPAHDPTGQWASLSSDMREWFKSLLPEAMARHAAKKLTAST